MLGAHADRNPVPEIDHADQNREIGDFLGREVLLQEFVVGIRCMGLGNLCQCFGPGQRRPLGSIEAARWRHQQPAWHLFKPDNAPDSLAICLVGNFEARPLPPEMLRALTDLTRSLMRLCEIPRERVSTHRIVDEKMTQCPGKLFPREQFLASL